MQNMSRFPALPRIQRSSTSPFQSVSKSTVLKHTCHSLTDRQCERTVCLSHSCRVFAGVWWHVALETLAGEEHQHHSLLQPSVPEDDRRYGPHLQEPQSGRILVSIGTTLNTLELDFRCFTLVPVTRIQIFVRKFAWIKGGSKWFKHTWFALMRLKHEKSHNTKLQIDWSRTEIKEEKWKNSLTLFFDWFETLQGRCV